MGRFFNWLKKYFIPHEGNEYRPHLLRYEGALVVFLVIIVIELAFLAQVFLVFDKTKFLAAVLPGVLESMTNDQRTANSLPTLTENALLVKAAQMKAQDMAAKGYFAHTSPEGKTPWYWFAQVGYKYSYAGENLAVNFFESADVAKAWMNSPTHRANIVKKDFTEIGIGVASGKYQGRNTVFVAQLFGTPVKVAPVTTTAPKPAPVTTTTTAPKVVAVNTTPAPTATQVLGEETDSAPVTPVKTAQSGSFKLFVEKLLSSPRESSTFTYIVIAGIIILVLLLGIFIRAEIQHPPMIARGVGLVAVIVLLLLINIRVLNSDTKVPTDASPNSIGASIIAN